MFYLSVSLAIVAARAGKDLISSLCSGLLTIGPRFGGALDGAAQQFAGGYDSGLSAEDFMTKMRRDKELIMGIGQSRARAGVSDADAMQCDEAALFGSASPLTLVR